MLYCSVFLSSTAFPKLRLRLGIPCRTLSNPASPPRPVAFARGSPFTTLDMYDFRAAETHFLHVRASSPRLFRSFAVPACPANPLAKTDNKKKQVTNETTDNYSRLLSLFSSDALRAFESCQLQSLHLRKNFGCLDEVERDRLAHVTLSTFRHQRYVPKLQRLSWALKVTASYEAALHELADVVAL